MIKKHPIKKNDAVVSMALELARAVLAGAAGALFIGTDGKEQVITILLASLICFRLKNR